MRSKPQRRKGGGGLRGNIESRSAQLAGKFSVLGPNQKKTLSSKLFHLLRCVFGPQPQSDLFRQYNGAANFPVILAVPVVPLSDLSGFPVQSSRPGFRSFRLFSGHSSHCKPRNLNRGSVLNICSHQLQYSKSNRLLLLQAETEIGVSQENDTFKRNITLDYRGPRALPYICYIPYRPPFSVLTTLKPLAKLKIVLYIFKF
jgi:hypothetical protein